LTNKLVTVVEIPFKCAMTPSGKFIACCWLIVGVVWAVGALSVKRTKEQQPVSGRLVHLMFMVLAAMLLSGRIGGPFLNWVILPQTFAMGAIGEFIMVSGLVTCIWARVVLGTNWSGRVTLKEEHELIRRGPYKVVRHPIYTGLLCMALGTAILVGRLGAFLALLIYFLSLWAKLLREEELMAKHFPDTYPPYKARTKALVPFLL
jgi:protein-S-isoprenylcysteine O-methyltransferase Ste14